MQTFNRVCCINRFYNFNGGYSIFLFFFYQHIIFGVKGRNKKNYELTQSAGNNVFTPANYRLL